MEIKKLELEEDEIVFLKSLESKLNVNEYSNLRNIIDKYMRIARDKSYEAIRYQERYEKANKRETENYNKYCNEETEKIKWQNYYKEVCNKCAKLEIELYLEKAKTKNLLKEKKLKIRKERF